MNWFIIAFISAVFSAGAALSQKKILFKTEALDFSFILSIISLVISFPFFLGISFELLNAESLFILYIKSVLGTFAFLCVMLVIKNFEISKALPLMVLTPGLVALFAYLFLGDSLSSKEILGIVLLTLGTYILEVPERKNIFNSFNSILKSKHYYYILIALALFTASAVLDRLLLTNYKLPPKYFMAFQQLFFAINFSLIFLFRKNKSSVKNYFLDKELLFWIILIAFLTVGYRYTQIEAIKLAPVALVLAVKRISVFFSTVAGGKIFKEKNLLIRSAATAVMIAGTILLLNY
ncbi:MAG TPA: EamA family transporter [Ignavibacteriaceae bacterium]|nr:EamA family transporter [Ignavibacteriaceae bacterium]